MQSQEHEDTNGLLIDHLMPIAHKNGQTASSNPIGWSFLEVRVHRFFSVCQKESCLQVYWPFMNIYEKELDKIDTPHFCENQIIGQIHFKQN